MQPTDILKREHRVIEQVLDCLERIASIAEGDGTLDRDAAAQAVDFFRGYADRCHHGKEEAHLFPLMEARGFPREGGPTGVMLYEHDQGRGHVRAMAAALERWDQDEPAARQQFLEHARSFVSLLRQHILKEDTCLFPMADEAFGDAEQQSLMDTFVRVEKEEIGEETHRRYEELADQLAERLDVPKRETAGG